MFSLIFPHTHSSCRHTVSPPQWWWEPNTTKGKLFLLPRTCKKLNLRQQRQKKFPKQIPARPRIQNLSETRTSPVVRQIPQQILAQNPKQQKQKKSTGKGQEIAPTLLQKIRKLIPIRTWFKTKSNKIWNFKDKKRSSFKPSHKHKKPLSPLAHRQVRDRPSKTNSGPGNTHPVSHRGARRGGSPTSGGQ